jgi:hypothetical protein
MRYISYKWTLPERMAIVFVITDIIRDYINLNCYGVLGSPNIQSVHEIMASSCEELEQDRKSIEELITSYESKHPGLIFNKLVKHYHELGD